MRRHPRTLRAFVTLVVATLPILASPPAHAGAASAGRTRIDAQIHGAQKHIDRWDRMLVHWQTRVARTAAHLQRVEALPEVRVATGPDYLSPRWTRRVLGGFPSPRARVRDAHRRLQSVLRDHRAREAQQQLQAWTAFVGELQAARASAVRDARRDASAHIPTGPVTYEGWARALLGMLGAPACEDDLALVVTWETAESTQAWFNPLATSHDMEGAGIFNSSGVRNYVSLQQGLEASRDTLEGGADSYGYGAIVDGLRSCAPARVTARAISDSAWCRGCAGGAYVTGLLSVVRGSWSEHAARLVSTPG